jgi:glutamyl-tRNA synthetase
MGFFYDEYMDAPAFDKKLEKSVVADILNRFIQGFDYADDANTWFEKVKALTEAIGFTSDMKAYKADPTAFPGTVADVSAVIRMAVTGKTNSPDLYSVMQVLGKERTIARIQAAISSL